MPHPTNNSGGLTFRTKLIVGMCGMVLLTGLAVVYVADRNYRRSTEALAESMFREVSRHAVAKSTDHVRGAAPVAESLQQLADQGLALDDFDKLSPQLLAFLKGNPGMTWVLYGDESGAYTGATRLADGRLRIERTHIVDGKTRLVESEVQPDGSWTVVKRDDDYGYDPRKRPFYMLAKAKRKLVWTPPYMFFTQGLPGISCVVPVTRPSGEFRGVISVEFDLNALSEFASQLSPSLSENSRVFLFTPDQTLLAHPNQRNLVGKGVKGKGEMLTLADTGDPLVDAFRANLKPEFVRPSRAEEFHAFRFDHDGAGYLASTTVFPIDDEQSWVVGAVAPESDFLADVWRTRWLTLAAAAGALCIAGLLAAALARRISSPVQAMIGFMRRVGEGDLEAKADFGGGSRGTGGGGREFRQVADALNRMIADLRERLHLRASLQVAMDVQRSLLPAADPASPPLLDVAGRSKYCDETGGDYFDFIDVSALSPHCLLVAVGDVMGHGIPSALVMATARAALRANVLRKDRLADLMTRTNQVLAADNRHNRFMTLSLLLIDAETRVVKWASGGHDPAIVYDPAAQTFHELDGGDMPLGIVEDLEYKEFVSDPLPPDGVLVVGTDGVWEMFDEGQNQYGKQRLQEVMRAHHASPSADIAAALEADLKRFRGEVNPCDDVTFVIVKFRPPATASPDSGAAGGR